jgi:hypothetical protein
MPTTHTRQDLYDAARICQARGLSRAEAELELSQHLSPRSLQDALDAAYSKPIRKTEEDAPHSAANF